MFKTEAGKLDEVYILCYLPIFCNKTFLRKSVHLI